MKKYWITIGVLIFALSAFGAWQVLARESQKSCAIKGNIAANGEKIYHLPGSKYYNKTIIQPQKGERWFCSESEAIAAGWRKAKS